MSEDATLVELIHNSIEHTNRQCNILTARIVELEQELADLKETLVEGAVILPDDFPD